MFNPISTYRIQFNRDFTFKQFRKQIPYLKSLGVKTIYASPIFKAVPGSGHGYDVLDPLEVNPEIGDLDELKIISAELKALGMNWIQDIVPNHMAFDPGNEWLMDVLKYGKGSKYAAFFDTGFADPWFEGKLMVPFLGDSLGDVIERGELTLLSKAEGHYFRYFDSHYPLNTASSKLINASSDLSDKALIRKLADKQHYRLCSWKETDQQINFRRFFTVNSLICTNIQHPEVFKEYHTLIESLVGSGIIQGIRVDHVDGLFDPTTYLRSLRKLIGNGIYLSVEKILENGEFLPDDWPIQGTTGYDFLAQVNQLFSFRPSLKKLKNFYKKHCGPIPEFEEAVYEKKRLILQRYMQGELDNLHRLLLNTVEKGSLHNLSAGKVKYVLGELLVRMPWYRFYGNSVPLPDAELRIIKDILSGIGQDRRSGVLDLRAGELSMVISELDVLFGSRKPGMLYFYQRCMQFSGPLMAKGVEDTLMYSNSMFIAHNEVGDSPGEFGLAVEDFHTLMKERQTKWPLSMNAGSTHDTKRGEDGRARLNVLSSLSEEWISKVNDWQELNSGLFDVNSPSYRNTAYFIYQALIAAYPMPGEDPSGFEERMQAYMQKAVREAKVHTNWSDPDEEYENKLRNFIASVLDPAHTFLPEFKEFHTRIADLGISNSLAQVLLRFTCPGVPDIYQGSELWDLSMVDPDNRRTVDYKKRSGYLKPIKKQNSETLIKELWEDRFSGKIKLWLTHLLLEHRAAEPEFYAEAAYIPLEITGRFKDHFLAFARRHGQKWTITVVSLFPGAKPSAEGGNWWKTDWSNTRILLPEHFPLHWLDRLTNKPVDLRSNIPIGDILTELPIAFLSSVSGSNKRSAGILMAISSLPSAFGIGDLGPEAYLFADFLSRSRQKYWQVLPLNPTSVENGNSPYSSNSAMAGNPLMVSPELLHGEGLLSSEQLKHLRLETADKVDYPKVEANKQLMLDLAWKAYQKQRTKNESDPEFDNFCEEEDHWLSDYALYLVLKKKHRGKPWYKWRASYRDREKAALETFYESNYRAIQRIKWEQFIFLKQWKALRAYASSLGIRMFGDLPFYVNHDSADVWARPEIFALNPDGSMIGVAGVPPDYFNSDGQLWGMPVFRWDVLKSKKYDWWIRRIRKNMQLFDLLRLDHFRAFESYWEVPAGEHTAIRGTWKKGPGRALFVALEKALGRIPFIAEDLGDIDQPVYDLRDDLGLPGMKVLQFGLGDDVADSSFAPHNFAENFVVYTGTHDNNTTRGWLNQDDPQAAAHLSSYLGLKVSKKQVPEMMLRLCYGSVARTAIAPVQDVIGLDESARMNTPSTATGNWEWRLLPGQIRPEHERFLREITGLYNRD